MINDLAEALFAIPAKDLHDMLADACSCAVLILLFRLLAAPYPLTNGPDLGDKLLRNALEWTDSAPLDAKLFYAMAGDKCASHFLEAVIECGLFTSVLPLIEASLMTAVHEYVKDDAGNFVVQSVMKRLSYELEQRNLTMIEELTDATSAKTSKKKKKSKHTTEQEEQDSTANASSDEQISTKSIYKVSKKLLEACLEPELFSELVQYKGGVALWMITLARHVQEYLELRCITISSTSEDEGVENWRNKVCIPMISYWTGVPTGTGSQINTYLTTKFMATKVEPDSDGKDGKDSVAAPSKPTAHNGKNTKSNYIPMDPAKIILARQLGALLSLKPNAKIAVLGADTPALAANVSLPLEKIVSAVAGLPLDAMQVVATSGQLSRVVLDPLIKYHSQSSHFQSKFMKTFTSLAATLAGHFVGQHIFRQVYTTHIDICICAHTYVYTRLCIFTALCIHACVQYS